MRMVVVRGCREVMLRRIGRHVGVAKANERLRKAVRAGCEIKQLVAAMTLGLPDEVHHILFTVLRTCTLLLCCSLM